MNKTLFLFTVALLALPLSCSKKAPNVKVESVTVVPASLSLVEGTSQQVRATVLPANATDPTVTWSSSNTQVATVNAGTVTAVKPGSATITATAGVQKGTCAVTVTARIINVSAVTLNKSKTTIIIGGSETLTATVSPADASDKSVSWSSSAPAVATVDQSGKVTAVSVGTADITVKTTDGNKTATCAVTVDPIVVTGVTLDTSNATLYIGENVVLTPTITPANATDQSVNWSSSAPAVATVDQDGRVKAVSVGSATITATAVSGGKTSTCVVTVQAAGGGTEDYGSGGSYGEGNF